MLLQRSASTSRPTATADARASRHRIMALGGLCRVYFCAPVLRQSSRLLAPTPEVITAISRALRNHSSGQLEGSRRTVRVTAD
jgi:hypothetical protein